jgi:type IV pilus assembly protein PilA
MRKRKKNEDAFTLIELMVVVGIIGILAMVAVPKFTRYQAKARQAEAKIGLSGIFTAEKSFFTEYSAYYPSMNAIGYLTEGQKRNYTIGFQDNTTGIAAASSIGYSGATDIPSLANINNTMTCTASVTLTGVTASVGQAFTAEAVGCIINKGATMDSWTMTDGKMLTNTTNGY